MTTSAIPAQPRGWVPADTFPVRLAQVRNRLGWNAKEAAVNCGFPAQSWRNWESGQHPRDMVTICERISEVTGVSVEWLLRGMRADLVGTTARYAADSLALTA